MSLRNFKVQVIARDTGKDHWVTVQAHSREDAIERVASLGEIVGEARLDSVAAPKDRLGVALVAIPVAGAAIGAISIMLGGGVGEQLIISIVMIIASAICIGVDASQWGITGRDSDGKRQTGAVGWAVGSALMWIIGYPAYMFRRTKAGASRLGLLGIFAAIIFVATPYAATAIRNTSGSGATTAQLEAEVLSQVRAKLASQPGTLFVRVSKVSLVHETGNKYSGLVEGTDGGATFTNTISVTFDGTNILWVIAP
jgi:hypothetical protein